VSGWSGGGGGGASCTKSYILVAIFFAETKVLVQSKSYVISVQAVGEPLQVEKMLFECYCNGGLSLHQTVLYTAIAGLSADLSTGTEASKPDCKASLAKKLMAFFRSNCTWNAIHVKAMLGIVWGGIPGWKVMFVAIV
jgi:hypothetical protein